MVGIGPRKPKFPTLYARYLPADCLHKNGHCRALEHIQAKGAESRRVALSSCLIGSISEICDPPWQNQPYCANNRF